MNNMDLTLAIANAIKPQRKRSERMVGYVPYTLKFELRHYKGISQKHEKITLLEKTIVNLVGKGVNNINQLAICLGLDITDEIENEMVASTLDTLKKRFQLIQGEDNKLSLTYTGTEFINNGTIIKTFSRSFDLYVEPLHLDYQLINEFFDNNSKVKRGRTELPSDKHKSLTIAQIKHLAQHQASFMEYPDNGVELLSADIETIIPVEMDVYLCFLQSIRDNSVRTIAYDSDNNAVIEQLSSFFDNDDKLRDYLLKQCLKAEIVNEDAIVVESGEKSSEQIETEKIIIAEADAKGETIIETRSNKYDDNVGRIYDSIEFENELNEIFEKHRNEEIWLISPWIKNYAFLHIREPQIRKFLDQGGAIFVGYSEPERAGEEMVDPQSMEMVQRLNRSYDKFYYMELPKFHMKNVIEQRGDTTTLYSGSFNILSFCINGNEEHYRMEQMAFANKNEAVKRRNAYLLQFAQEYVKDYLNEIKSSTSDSKIDLSKLKYLRETGILDDAIRNVEELAKVSKLSISSMNRPNEQAMLETAKKAIAQPYTVNPYKLQARLASILYIYEYAKDKKDNRLIQSIETIFHRLINNSSIYNICRFSMQKGKVDGKKSIVNIICNGLNFEFGEILMPKSSFAVVSKHREHINYKEENIRPVKPILREVFYNSVKAEGLLSK